MLRHRAGWLECLSNLPSNPQLLCMGGQGFIPEDGKGALVEGSEEAKERREEHAYERPVGAPRAGMQGKKERGAAPTPILERPGTTPEDPPGTGSEPRREGGRVQDPKTRNTP
jgi:hypothetical protein